MTRDDVLSLNRSLAALLPEHKPGRFLWTPDGGSGTPVFVFERRRISPRVQLDLIKSGARRFISGRVARNAEGYLVLRAGGLDDKRLAALVAGLAADVPILQGALLG